MPMERLAWQNRFVRELVQELNAYSEADCEGKTPQTISGPDNLVILRVSLEEWEKLYSSVYTGADICYPSESDDVRWILNRAVECPVDLCELIVNCIMNNPATMEAIIDKLKESEEFNDFMREAVEAAPGAVTGSALAEGCDNDFLAGSIIALVDNIDLSNIDFLEDVEVGTNDEERVSRLIAAVPGLGVLPADEILNTFQEFLSDFKEGYESAVTLAWKDEVSRALYCIAQEHPECVLTFGQVFDYFKNRAGSELTLGSLIQNVVSFVLNGDFSTDELVRSGMYTIALGFMMTGGAWSGTTIQLLTAIASDAEPSNRWETWDPCEPSEEICYDFTTGEHGWDLDNPAFAVYVPGEGFAPGGFGNIDIGTPPPFDTNAIEIEWALGATSVLVYRDLFANGVGFTATAISPTRTRLELASPILTSDDLVALISVGPMSAENYITEVCLYS